MLPSLGAVDLGEDLFVLGEAIGRRVRLDRRVVDRDLEDAAGAFLEASGDAVLILDGGLQTGGLGQVVSLAAVQDLDVHAVPPSRPRRSRGTTLDVILPSGLEMPRAGEEMR